MSETVNTLKISSAGIDFIKQWEGFSHHVYRDSAGLPTIGYGHLLRPGEHIRHFTWKEAEESLLEELQAAEETVNDHVTVSLTQSQFDSLVSFVFNVGSHAFSGSTLLYFLNNGQFNEAGEQFMRWDKIHVHKRLVPCPGLTNRRRAEKAMFLGVPFHVAA